MITGHSLFRELLDLFMAANCPEYGPECKWVKCKARRWHRLIWLDRSVERE